MTCRVQVSYGDVFAEAILSEHLFDELKRYVGFTADDEALLRALHDRVQPRIQAIIDDFYDHILAHAGARTSITGGQAQVERLKITLRAWIDSFFVGPWDAAYFERRARIGRRHVEIDLPQQYMFTAMNVIRGYLTDRLVETAASPAQLRQELRAVDKLLDMELAIMLHTYREDYLLRVQRKERLATFGQLVASIGHELRNPLSVIESSLYLIRKRSLEEPVAKHLAKIAHQVKLSNRIISELLDMVRERPLVRGPVELTPLLARAIAQVEPPTTLRLRRELAAALPKLFADADLVQQILVNLITNAVQVAGSSGEVLVAARAESDHVAIVIADTGPGIDPSIRARLFEPLVTTRAHGIGLGLALSRQLAERNGGTLVLLAKSPLPGAAFELRLPFVRERQT